MTDHALYLDDGGHPDDQPFLVVAGFVATESQWLAFEPAWRETLSKLNLGTEFHMTDFMREKYTEFKREKILSSLAAVIKSHTLRPFVCAVDMLAYKRVQEEFALEEAHGAPFALAGRTLAKELHFWQKENLGPDDKFLTFVEEGTKHYGDLEQVFKRDRLPLPNRVPKSMPQVQPSDILAWEVFRFLRSGSPKRMRKNLDRMTRSIRKQQSFGGILYEKDLRNLCAETLVHLRKHLPPGDPIRFGGGGEKKRPRRRTIR